MTEKAALEQLLTRMNGGGRKIKLRSGGRDRVINVGNIYRIDELYRAFGWDETLEPAKVAKIEREKYNQLQNNAALTPKV